MTGPLCVAVPLPDADAEEYDALPVIELTAEDVVADCADTAAAKAARTEVLRMFTRVCERVEAEQKAANEQPGVLGSVFSGLRSEGIRDHFEAGKNISAVALHDRVGCSEPK